MLRSVSHIWSAFDDDVSYNNRMAMWHDARWHDKSVIRSDFFRRGRAQSEEAGVVGEGWEDCGIG